MSSATALSYYNLAKTLESQHQWERAIEHYQQALRLAPDYIEAYGSLGNLWQQQNQLEAALTCYQQILRIAPTSAPAYGNMGNIYATKQQWELAATCYRRVLQLWPEEVNTYHRLGEVLWAQQQWPAVIDCYQQLLRLQPQVVINYVKLSEAYLILGNSTAAVACYQPALQWQPPVAALHFQYALLLLKLGRFQEGWEEYEWRLQSTAIDYHLPRPPWTGSPLAGRRLLVHWEQGLGDTIQFVRYLSLIQGGQVILAGQPVLANLLRGVTGIDELIVNESDHLPNVEYEVWISLLSLPRMFTTSLANIPATVPYLQPDPHQQEKWRARLKQFNPSRFKIGLVWAGSPTHENDSNRSCPLSLLTPLAHLAQITWFSLQKGPAVSQLPPPGLILNCLHDELIDFSDTAAVIAELDLVISVDTAVAHLAGAMGQPVWVLLPFISDWRWLINRADSPWYPTMKLFRQSRAGDWQGVLTRVKEELERTFLLVLKSG